MLVKKLRREAAVAGAVKTFHLHLPGTAQPPATGPRELGVLALGIQRLALEIGCYDFEDSWNWRVEWWSGKKTE